MAGNDTLEGQDGADAMLFFGSKTPARTSRCSANDGRVRFVRDVAAVMIDLNDVESIDFRASGGADNIVVATSAAPTSRRTASSLEGPTAAATAKPTRSR